MTGLRRLTAHCVLAALASIGIVACGGEGGSSSGGGFAGDHAGTYAGTSELTLSSPGVPTQHESVATTIVVSADGSATISTANDSGQVGVTNGRVEGDTLSAHADSAALFPGGVACSGAEDVNGTIVGDMIEGTVTGSGSCTGPGGTIPFSINGTFSVVLTSSDAGMSAARAGSSGILGTIAAELAPWVR